MKFNNNNHIQEDENIDMLYNKIVKETVRENNDKDIINILRTSKYVVAGESG